MGFKASNIQVKGESLKNDVSLFDKKVQIELSEKELEFLLVTIKNGLFKGEYVEILYNLTLKLQKNFVSFKDKK